MSQQEPPDSRALSRLSELLRDAPSPPTHVELERGLSAVRARLARSRTTRARGSRWAWAASLAALGAALVVAALALHGRDVTGERAIAVSRIEGGQLLQNGYLSESSEQGVRLFFDEGSQFALTPGGRGRLRFDGANGVRLLLERGEASLQITKTREPRWSVESGPFLVSVRGTDFTVGWDPTSEHFELTLRRGRVVVSGPLLGDDFAVRPGQKLSVSLPRGETVITEARPPLPSASPPATATPRLDELPATGPEASSAAALLPKPPASVAPPPRQWRGALANGEFDRILAEAERAGIDATLDGASSDDLFALADAARYRRRVELAQAALLAQRRRFPGSPRAAEAIFLLGRVAELRPSGRAAAVARYDEYLARAPGGTYAAEALGRKMTLVSELDGPTSARPVAEAYLRRFPRGSYAGAARTLLRVGE